MDKIKIDMAGQMRHHIEACKASGLFVEEYCKLHQLKPSVYYYWRKKLLGVSKVDTGAFIQLHAPSVSAGGVEVVFANGVKINFTSLVPIDYLKQLVR